MVVDEIVTSALEDLLQFTCCFWVIVVRFDHLLLVASYSVLSKSSPVVIRLTMN